MRSSLVVAFLILPVASAVPEAGPVQEGLRAPLGSDLAAVRATLALPRATVYNDRDGDRIFDETESAFQAEAPGARLQTHVLFRYDADLQRELAQARGLLAVEPTHVFHLIKGFAAPLTSAEVQRLATLPNVRQIQLTTPGSPELDTAGVTFGARAVHDRLGITGDLDGSPDVHNRSDIVVAVLDTGFHTEHRDLDGKFVALYNAASDEMDDVADGNGHGTHVASIAAGLGKAQAQYRGVAPGAALVGVKIIGGTDTKADAIKAVEWLVDNRDVYNVRILTISFGFGPTRDGTDALEIAMDAAFEASILPFKSAGNSGPERGTITVPGGARGIVAVASFLDAGTSGDAPPAETPVGSQGRDVGFHLSRFSSRGPTADGRVKPDLAAPGQSITAAARSRDGYTTLSGTSMAAPFAAGAAALVWAADPSLTNQQVRDLLLGTVDDWGAPGPDPDHGAGRLDVLAAVKAARVARLMRENASVDDVRAVAEAEGPRVPFHAYQRLSRASNSFTFQVQDRLFLAVSAIADVAPVAERPDAAPNALVVPPCLNPNVPGLVLGRVLVLQLRDPSGSVVARTGLTCGTERHHLLTIEAPVAGRYQVEVLQLRDDQVVDVDVSAGLPPPDLLPKVVVPDDYVPLARPLAQSTPALSLFMAAVALMAAFALRRRA